MEWVLQFAFCWWLVVATIFFTVVFRTTNKKPEPRVIPVKPASEYDRVQIKRF